MAISIQNSKTKKRQISIPPLRFCFNPNESLFSETRNTALRFLNRVTSFPVYKGCNTTLMFE